MMMKSVLGIAVKMAAVSIVPYLFGLMCSSKIVPADYFRRSDPVVETTRSSLNIEKSEIQIDRNSEKREKESHFNAEFDVMMKLAEKGDPFEGLRFVVHRNGEASPCGQSTTNALYETFRKGALSLISYASPGSFDKYDFDSFLTRTLAEFLLSKDTCHSTEPSEKGSTGQKGLLGYCDLGPDHTPIQLDHEKLVPVRRKSGEESLPCHFHTREGRRVTSLQQLADLARDGAESAAALAKDACSSGGQHEAKTCASNQLDVHLYAVPAGRVFIFAPSHVGEIFHLPHVKVPGGLPVSLKVLSLEPRVFDVFNFFDKEESAEIVRKAKAETSESHRIKRSSTGSSGYNINSRRTSENGFDTHGKIAIAVKKRCFDVLGFDEYLEGSADGLQVLRYNTTTAYTPHLDWIDDPRRREEHNYDSEGVGSNRFATILLYMTDMEEGDGGETVFVHGWPIGQPESEHEEYSEALKAVRESGVASMFDKGSWEEEMVAQCRSRLAIRPNSARAVLFYSQHPNGTADESSLHGGCPVLSGEKWAANLWVWNAPRGGFPGSPVNADVVEKNKRDGKQPEPSVSQLHTTFSNSNRDPNFKKADLYFQETFWGHLGHGDPPLAVNTFEGHEWNVIVDGEVKKTWVITKDKKQYYSI